MGKIVWIASYPRSGNTWVRYFLQCLVEAMAGRGDAAPDLDQLHRFSTWDALAVWWEPRLGRPLPQATKAEVAAKRAEVQAAIAEAGPPVAFVKTHNAWATVGGHPTVNAAVTAGAVYLLRNPLDVAVSTAAYLNLTPDEAIGRLNRPGYETHNMAGGVYELYGSWRQHAVSWLSRRAPPVLALRYEDLLQRPQEAFGRLAAFLRMEPTPEQLERAIGQAAFARLEEQESEKGFLERPDFARRFFRRGESGQWREVLTPAQVAAVVAANRDLMQRFRYLPEEE